MTERKCHALITGNGEAASPAKRASAHAKPPTQHLSAMRVKLLAVYVEQNPAFLLQQISRGGPAPPKTLRPQDATLENHRLMRTKGPTAEERPNKQASCFQHHPRKRWAFGMAKSPIPSQAIRGAGASHRRSLAAFNPPQSLPCLPMDQYPTTSLRVLPPAVPWR